MKKIVLIDLGGVLADLGDPVTAMRLPMSESDFWRIWIGSRSVRNYEAGAIGLDRFAERMAAELDIGDAREFLARFHAWQLTVFPGIGDVLRSAAEYFRLAMLSNTNPVHWEQVQSSAPVFGSFEKLFLSFETGKLKPTPAAFAQVLEHFGCSADDVFFLDDSPGHVEGARRLGIRSEQVNGPAELADTLARLQRDADRN